MPTIYAEELMCLKCREDIVVSRAENGSLGSRSELRCPACEHVYPIVDGVLHFSRNLNEQDASASSFGFAWTAFWRGRFGKDSVFGLKIAGTTAYFLNSLGIEEQHLKGSKILDAGTGSGRVPMSLRDHDCLVCAVDTHDGLGVVNKAIGTASIHVYQADLMELPFKNNLFDYVWSSGVIHHTPDSREAFKALASKVRPGGRLFISVYGKMLHPYRVFRRLLPFSSRLPLMLNYVLASVISVPLYAAFNGVLFCVRLTARRQRPPYTVLGFSIENIDRKSYRAIVLNVFDQLHPVYQREHSAEEVEGWFQSNGFKDIVATNVVGMVEMRGVKAGTVR